MPVEGIEKLWEIKVVLPVVFTDMLVNVFPLTLNVPTGIELLMYTIVPEAPATVCPKVLKSLLLILSVEVEKELVAETFMPFIAPAVTALLKEIVLLLIAWVYAIEGVFEYEFIKIPLSVPEVVPPFELATEL